MKDVGRVGSRYAGVPTEFDAGMLREYINIRKDYRFIKKYRVITER